MKNKFVFLLVLITLLVTPLLNAQEVSPATIHVVQRDETLYQIALQYGVGVDSIITANNIVDADSLQVGQRLIIPNAQAQAPGMIVTHVVEPGETLRTIAAQYNSTLESLSLLNHISHESSLYIGQSIQVSQGATGSLPPENISMYVVKPTDSWLDIAARFKLMLADLAQTNQLDPALPLQAGQRLILPGITNAGRFVDFPAPIANFSLGPLPAIQGQALSAEIFTEDASQVTGKLLDRTINFTQEEGGLHHAMVGIHAFTPPGIYPLQIQIMRPDGTQMIYEARIYVQDGGYGQEEIDVLPEREGLLAPEIIQQELDLITNTMSGFTPQRYFDGLMSLPSTGPVTSLFGTRRSYEGSGYDTFHGGADFGGAPGTLILAPTAGVVVLAEALNVRGNAVIIDHGWGVYTGYWHMTQIYVAPGQQVQRGDPLGTLGSTGLVTGAHLHWEMWVGGVQVNPLQWLSHEFQPAAE